MQPDNLSTHTSSILERPATEILENYFQHRDIKKPTEYASAQDAFAAFFSAALKMTGEKRGFGLKADGEVCRDELCASLAQTLTYDSNEMQKMRERGNELRGTGMEDSSVKSILEKEFFSPEQQRHYENYIKSNFGKLNNLAAIIERGYKSAGEKWMFANKRELIEHPLFLPFLKKFSVLLSEKMAQEPTMAGNPRDINIPLEPKDKHLALEKGVEVIRQFTAHLDDYYFQAIAADIPKKKPKKSHDSDYISIPISKTIAIPTSVPLDAVPEPLALNVRHILNKIASLPGNKYTSHKEKWVSADIGGAIETVLDHCKPSQHKPLIELLTQKPFFDMLLEATAPNPPEAAVSVSALNLPAQTWNSGIHISSEVHEAYKNLRKQDKRTSVTEARLEIISRITHAIQDETAAPLADALKKIQEILQGREKPRMGISL